MLLLPYTMIQFAVFVTREATHPASTSMRGRSRNSEVPSVSPSPGEGGGGGKREISPKLGQLGWGGVGWGGNALQFQRLLLLVKI